MPPAARATDMHVCPMVTVLVPHVGGPILPPCEPTVLIGFLPAARVTDMLTCVGPPDIIVMGSPTVLIGGLMAARIGDPTAHGGAIILGCFTVMIGEAGAPGGPTIVTPGGPVQFGGIVITGSPAFQGQVLSDLAAIRSTPTGGKLLDAINSSGKTVTIQETTSGNSCGYSAPAARFLDSGGKPGSGTDVTVSYSSKRKTIGPQPWETRPPAVGLAHELCHAEQAAHGTMSTGEVNNDAKPDPNNPSGFAKERKREVEAVGISPNDNREFTENKIRGEWNPKQTERKWY
jgi:type VI secretion system secreted protein VgrG